MLSRFGEISEHTDRHTDRQTDTRTALLYLYEMFGVNLSFRHHFRYEDDLVAKCHNLLFSCL